MDLEENIIALKIKLEDIQIKAKKRKNGEQKEMLDKIRSQDQELEVLKEMIRGTKLQLKSKDTDIQRLNIKIKRLEKTNEIRENMINQVALNMKNGKEIDLQPGSVMGKMPMQSPS